MGALLKEAANRMQSENKIQPDSCAGKRKVLFENLHVGIIERYVGLYQVGEDRHHQKESSNKKRKAINSKNRFVVPQHQRAGTLGVRPLDFIAKLAVLLPKPRVNLTRFHGVFVGMPPSTNRKFRVRVTLAKRGSGRKPLQTVGENWLDKTPAERHASMIWMHSSSGVYPPRVGDLGDIDPEAAPLNLQMMLRPGQDHCRDIEPLH